jgi:two-component system response regulator HydG
MPTILLVEDDIAFCNMLKTFLQKKGFEVDAVYNFSGALKNIEAKKYDIILTDVRLPENEGTEILTEVISRNIDSKVILMTGYAEVSMAVEVIKKGAFDYISKPVSPEKLLETIQNALKKNSKPLKSENTSATSTLKESYIQGVSDASKKLNDYIRLVAPTNMSVLIVGDSGTGKEYIAKTIHDKSKRSSGSFVPVDCGTIPKEIASSEFFGHVKGSFTGAISNKTGHFEAANGGTLFLDEIGNLSYELQVQLLRALQERKIKPVGSSKEIEVDIRIIAATNENLENAVKEGTFREDLYHRLNEFSIKVPLLKERKEDIMLFANYFLENANTALDKNVVGFQDEVIKVLQKYSWPGNLREMQNAIKRAVLLCQEEYISILHLPLEIVTNTNNSEGNNFSLYKNQTEKELIIEALQKTGGNKSKAAKLLGIDRKTLYNKLSLYDINL